VGKQQSFQERRLFSNCAIELIPAALASPVFSWLSLLDLQLATVMMVYLLYRWCASSFEM